MLPDWFVTDCRREFDRDPGSTETFLRLLNLAAEFGRESAYTTDEWRIVAAKPRTREETVNNNARSEWEARALLKVARGFDPEARLERRRAGATDWEKVADDRTEG